MPLTSGHWFCILPLCRITVWVLEILRWRLLGILCRVSCHRRRGRVWLLLCQFECLLFLFAARLLRLGLPVLCWIAVVRVDIPVFSWSQGKGSQCFPIENDICCGLSYMAFKMLRNVPSIPTLWRVLIRNGCCILSNAFSASVERIIGFLFLLLLIWWITLIVLRVLNQPCIPGINTTCSWWINFIYCWILLASILLRM